MSHDQMDTDGFTGHAHVYRHAKKRFFRAAEDYMRVRGTEPALIAFPEWRRLVAAWEELERAR